MLESPLPQGPLAGPLLPRLVVVTNVPFWRRMGGSQERIHDLVKALSRRFEIDVFLTIFPPKDVPRAGMADLPMRILSWSEIDISGAPPALESGAKAPEHHRSFIHTKVATAYQVYCERERPAAAIYHYISTAYLNCVEAAPRLSLLDTLDVMSSRQDTFLRFLRKHHIRINRINEMRIFDEFQGVIAIQREDHQLFADALGASRAWFASISARTEPRTFARQRARSVIFVGADSPMNADAARWLQDEVWPLFRGRGARLIIGGTVCGCLGEPSPGVTHVGPLSRDALEDLYRSADIAVNPVSYGGGLKIKTIDYARFSIPAVISAEGSRGLRCGEDAPFLTAVDRRSFVAALDRLLDDAELRLALSLRAAPWIEREFGADAADGLVSALFDLAVREDGRRSTHPRLPEAARPLGMELVQTQAAA